MTPEWRAAERAVEVAQASDRLWRAASETRIARLKLAHELETQGRTDEATAIIEQVRAEQEAG